MSTRHQGSAELSVAKRDGYFSIGQAARLTGVTAKMIRHYEQLRLMPKATRSSGDYRLYGENELHTLRFIRRARNLGFSMEEIGNLLGLWRNQRRASAEVKRLALKHVQELDRRIADLQAMKASLTQLTACCHGDDRPDCPILEDLAALQDSHADAPAKRSADKLANKPN